MLYLNTYSGNFISQKASNELRLHLYSQYGNLFSITQATVISD
ncbi:hypothetical protein HMPREF0541_01790 [Lacticaseibacillus rhamnosus ATCC 21052]|nr:hypothetical protein HMPREF0541_01790 [Lacticaseibacillus rhamnosus ATCC 21052]